MSSLVSRALPAFAVASLFIANPAPSGAKESRGPSSAELAEKLHARMKKLAQNPTFKPGELGIWVGERTDKGLETYYSLNNDKLMIPASLSKLVTLGAVLHELGPAYKYKTHLVSDAKVEAGALGGNLYLKGGGDPSFVSENMWFLVNELTRTGITSVEGDIVVDDSRFDGVRWGEDRQEERVDRAYDAPIGAMSMNWNSVTVNVRPGDKVGDKLKVFADVMSPYLKIKNETRTVAAGKGKTVAVERGNEKDFAGDVITVTGAMALGNPEAVIYKSISQPDMWSGYNLVEFLRQRGIAVKGKVRTGASPKDAPILATAESKPLVAVVADMAKWSNNYVAEMLVKNLSAENGDVPGNTAAGMSRVHKYLEKAGIKTTDLEFQNAAGLTRKNRMTVEQIGRFLGYVHTDFQMFPEYLSALPIGGVDGTLRSRMKNSAAERWVRAKTGLLTGAVGLAGYAGRSNGSIVTFAFVYNGNGREDRARTLFDQMAAAIAED